MSRYSNVVLIVVFVVVDGAAVLGVLGDADATQARLREVAGEGAPACFDGECVYEGGCVWSNVWGEG